PGETPSPSPLAEALRDAERNINDIMGDDSTHWRLNNRYVGGADQEWVVGDNTGIADGREVRMGQSMGPKAKDGEVFYRARTPGGDIYWQHGAKNLSELRYGPDRNDSTYTSAGMAMRALRSVSAARLREDHRAGHGAA
ncbi:MAG TPA: hypothetical protein VLA88_01530, partial [Candidatus Saccharimonadales bacterium]|nr:hypothetical protein [Candidatus Saccharimonadales bacterium]